MTTFSSRKAIVFLFSFVVLGFFLADSRGTRCPASDAGDDDSPKYPESLSDLLHQGLVKTDPESMRTWRACHKQLIQKGVDATQADLAIALIFASAERYDEMRRTLQAAQKRHPGRPDTLRLLSWARLSDRQFIEGLEDICKLVAIAYDPKSQLPAAAKQEAINYAGAAFGFAEIVIKEVRPERQGRFVELRHAVENLLPEDDKTTLMNAFDAMRARVTEELKDTLELKDQKSEEQQAEKDLNKAHFEAQQAEMKAEAAHRQQQAMEIERDARIMLGDLQRAAAPLFAQRSVVAAELNQLTAERSRQEEDFDKQRFDPAIASARGQLDGIDSQLQPLIIRYNQVEQTALGQLQALGMRVNQLGRIHGATTRRLAANDAQAANGLTGKVSADLRRRTRLATYMPLNFDAERELLLAGRYSTSVRLD